VSIRLRTRLTELKAENRAGFVPFIMAGDPNVSKTAEILAKLPDHGADIIELGMPFSDPTADGPTIQAAGLRALKAGYKLEHLFELLEGFRANDTKTPVILMGYANPVFHYGVEAFMKRAAQAGADGFILVDIPAEERAPYLAAAKANDLSLIPLIAPTSLQDRLTLNCDGADGFVYYISIKGITGTASADMGQLCQDIGAIRAATDAPIAAGFGINTAQDVADVSRVADLVVVGSAIVKADDVLAKCRELAAGIQPK
jgi:tryptophan synthase alpha chain